MTPDPNDKAAWDAGTQSSITADFAQLGDDRRFPSASPRNLLLLLDVRRGTVFWHRAGDQMLRCAGPEFLIASEELDSFAAEAIALIAAMATARETRLIIQARAARAAARAREAG